MREGGGVVDRQRPTYRWSSPPSSVSFGLLRRGASHTQTVLAAPAEARHLGGDAGAVRADSRVSSVPAAATAPGRCPGRGRPRSAPARAEGYIVLTRAAVRRRPVPGASHGAALARTHPRPLSRRRTATTRGASDRVRLPVSVHVAGGR